MEGLSERVIGYLLLIAGVIVIIFSGLSVYKVFTGRAEAFGLFNFDSVSIDPSTLIGGDLPPEQRALVQQELSKSDSVVPELEILPKDVLNSTSNTVAHLLLMGFMASIGLRLAQIGSMLVRPIKVSVKEAKTYGKQEEKTNQK